MDWMAPRDETAAVQSAPASATAYSTATEDDDALWEAWAQSGPSQRPSGESGTTAEPSGGSAWSNAGSDDDDDDGDPDANATNDDGEMIVNENVTSTWHFPDSQTMLWNGNDAFQFGSFQSLLVDIDTDAQRLLLHPEGGLTIMHSKTRDLLRRLLLLTSPRLTDHIVDLLQSDANMDIFMGFYSRIAAPAVNVEGGDSASLRVKWPPVSGVQATLSQCLAKREQETEHLQQLSHCVMTILTTALPLHIRLLDTRLRELVVRLFDVFHPASNGNFHHYSKMALHFMTVHPERFLNLVMLPLPEQVTFPADTHTLLPAPVIQRPFIFRALPYLHHSPVIVSVLRMILWTPPDEAGKVEAEALGQKARLESLHKEGILEFAMQSLCIPTPDEAQVQGISEFIVRLTIACTEFDNADILFAALSQDESLIRNCLALLQDDQVRAFQFRAITDVLYALGVQSQQRVFRPLINSSDNVAGEGAAAASNGQNNTPDPNAAPPPSIIRSAGQAVMRIVMTDLPRFSEIVRRVPVQKLFANGQDIGTVKLNTYEVKRPISRTRLHLVELFVSALELTLADPSLLDSLPVSIFLDMTDWFFELRFNNIYHGLFYRLVRAVVASGHKPTLKKLLAKARLVQRLIEHYQDTQTPTGSRGHILLILNYLRLTVVTQDESADYIPQLLSSCSEWKLFLPILWSDTKRQVGTGAGVDLGSYYAYSLGFSEASMQTKVPTESTDKKKPSRRKKKKKRKSISADSESTSSDDAGSDVNEQDEDETDDGDDGTDADITDTRVELEDPSELDKPKDHSEAQVQAEERPTPVSTPVPSEASEIQVDAMS